MRRLAIVNLPFFGMFSRALEEAQRFFDQVEVLSIDPDAPPEKVAEVLGDTNLVIAASSPRYTREVFRSCPRLLAVVRWGVGYDNVDVEGATEEGVIVSRVPGYVLRESVAVLAVALLLACLRRVVYADRFVRSGMWPRKGGERELVGKDVRGLTIGLLGLGNIGSRVLEILKAFNPSRILVYDPYIPPHVIRAMGGEPVGSVEELLSRSDAVSIHVPLTSETRHLVNKERLSRAKKGMVLVNTSRGGVVDTQALIRALEEGVVSCAALDVVEGEPIGGDHPLLKHPNVIVTPHIGSASVESYRAMDEASLEEAVRIVRGEKPLWIVNPEVLSSPKLRVRLFTSPARSG